MNGGGLKYVAVLIDVDEYGTVKGTSVERSHMPCFGLYGRIFFVTPGEGVDAVGAVFEKIGVFHAAGDEFIERPALVGLLGHIYRHGREKGCQASAIAKLL
jgi:hypothetical protein